MLKVLLVSTHDHNQENRDGITKINYHLSGEYDNTAVSFLSLEKFSEVRKRSKIAWFLQRLPYNVLPKEDLKILGNKINAISHEYDVIHISSIALGELPSLIKEREKIFFSSIDSYTLLFRRRSKSDPSFLMRLIWRMEALKARTYEKRLYPTLPIVHFVSPVDEHFAKKMAPETSTVTIPNGIDPSSFFPIQQSEKEFAAIFVGHHGSGPNRDASAFLIKDVMPLVGKIRPQIRLYLVGQESEKLNSSEANITKCGYVEDLNSILNTCKLFVSPLFYGAGIKNKILEALASGLPILATPLSMEGIEAYSASIRNVSTRDPKIWAKAIVDIIDRHDNVEREALRTAKFIAEKYSWNNIRNSYEKSWQDLAWGIHSSDQKLPEKYVPQRRC